MDLIKIDNAIIEKIENVVLSGIGEKNMRNFEKAFRTANAITELKNILTPQIMKPINNLMGTSLGFKTDKQYSIDIVKSCLIEALLFGVEVVGNHFNIIGGNTYITKEGFKFLLDKENIDYSIIVEAPINIDDKMCEINNIISWVIDGKENKQEIKFSLVYQYKTKNGYTMTNPIDMLIGKSTRKARKWLYERITGNVIPDGENEDNNFNLDPEKEIKEETPFQEKEEKKKLFSDDMTKEEKRKKVEEILKNAGLLISDLDLFAEKNKIPIKDAYLTFMKDPKNIILLIHDLKDRL